MEIVSQHETALLKLEMRMSIVLAVNVISAIMLAVLLRMSAYLPLMLGVTAFGVVVVRFRNSGAYGVFVLYTLSICVLLGVLMARNYGVYNGSFRLAIVILHACTCLAVFIEALHIMRQIRINKIAESTAIINAQDLENQETEMAPLYASSESTPAPSAAPMPIYIAVPAYYPHYNGDQPGFAQFEAGAGQYVPIPVDASGHPIGHSPY